MCVCLLGFAGLCVCVHTIGLLCYSRLSGTLVRTYLSMSEQTAENKLICYSPPSSLSSPSFTCFLPSLSLYINLCLTRHVLSISSLFSSLCFCKMQHCPKKNHPSFCPSLLFAPYKCELLRVLFGVLHGFQLYSMSCCQSQKQEEKMFLDQLPTTVLCIQ